MSGELSEKNKLRDFELGNPDKHAMREIAILFAFGVFAAIMKAYAKEPLHLPGHEWVIWMALLVIGRATSPFRYAGSVMGIGASAVALVPALGLAEPFFFLYFIIPALIFDIAYLYFGLEKRHWIFMVLLSGFALGIKALTQYAAYAAVGMKYTSAIKYGLAYPVFLHIGFGLAGGFVGIIIFKFIKHRSSELSK